MALVNDPTPAPSIVFWSAIVGSTLVLQQTPRAVTVDPASVVTIPPEAALFSVTEVTSEVVIVGIKPESGLGLHETIRSVIKQKILILAIDNI